MIIITYETNGKVFEQHFTGRGGIKKPQIL